MGYRETIHDGQGNVLEEKILYTVEQYKAVMLNEIKEVWKDKFPTQEKQHNLALGLINEPEASQLKEQMKAALVAYEQVKTAINSATTLEDVHHAFHPK